MRFFAAGVIAVGLIGCGGAETVTPVTPEATVESVPSALPGTVEAGPTPTYQVTSSTGGDLGGSVIVGTAVVVGPDVTGMPGSPTPASPTDTPEPQGGGPGGNGGDTLRITMDDSGKTITLHVGDEFLLYLEGGVDQPERLWSVDISDQGVVQRVMGIMVIKGAQGLFRAVQPGQALLQASGDLPCRTAAPPCMAPTILFQVTIVVE